MKIIQSFNWLATWLSMSVLKRSLRYRLKGGGAIWLQQVASNKPAIFNRVDFILDHCRDKKVLHTGFTDHPYTEHRIKDGFLLHLQLQQVTAKLLGIDVEETALRQYTALTKDDKVCMADITVAYPAPAREFKPDLILLSEVLEHLQDPYKAIEILHKSFQGGTTILVTVPNYTALDSLAASLNYTESIHPYHHWYFSPFTLQRLFDDKRFKLNQLHFGMYYKPKKSINAALKKFPYNGDCIMALFTIIKNHEHD